MSAGGHLEIDPTVLRASLDRVPFPVRHRLAGHPLFEPPRLVELARRLGPGAVEYNAGDVPLSLDPAQTPHTGLSAEETIRRIAECGSWMALKWVERDPEYATLLDECLDSVQGLAGPALRGMRQREGFIFLASPRSTTPYHLDPESNFLLQIRGSKTCDIIPRSAVADEVLEEHFAGAHRNLVLGDDERRLATTFILSPGDGVHIPVAAPHWVVTGDEVSISFSITFRTPDSDRDAVLHGINARLRRWGFRPAPVRRSGLRDSVKLGAFRIAKQVARGLRPAPREGRA
jgi:hypothetical protein